ncbi:ABC transporter ATP-binding protein [Klebsiella variicola]|nr:ABC transporter ATP-binding protein [Klebsiella variicola]
MNPSAVWMPPCAPRSARWVFEELARQAIPAILVTHDREDGPPAGRCLAMETWQ